ncbi:MAG: hypothetical protein JWM93_3322 [Frankiales bacterium]|nr:hypothetical protein [Frankiales bacterium]
MANIVGMDVDAVEQLARDLHSQSDALKRVLSEVDRIVHSLGDTWHGARAREFQSWWREQHHPRLMTAAEHVHGLSQSAHNNAQDQRHASGGGAASAAPPASMPAASAPSGTHAAPTPNGKLPGSERTWQEVDADYRAHAAAYGLGSYSAGGDYGYQCTAWANYRWRELGYAGALVNGYGWEMASNAGGTVDTPPVPGSMASYGTAKDMGHVMIVEEVSASGDRIRVSEMNTGSDGSSGYDATASEYRSSSWLVRQSNGTWARDGGVAQHAVTFATLPHHG